MERGKQIEEPRWGRHVEETEQEIKEQKLTTRYKEQGRKRRNGQIKRNKGEE